jgi:spermidine synthase
MHEVVWSRQLVQLVGAEAYAQVVALAVFMAGLAGGALLARGRADRGQALRDYVRLEVAIAAYGLALPLLLAAAGAGYLALARLLFESDGARLALRFVLTTVVVAPPALLMGATLPLLAGGITRGVTRASTNQLRRRVSGLYAANCAGAVIGTGLSGFVALPLLGTWGALGLAAAANIIAAALVLPIARRVQSAAVAGVLATDTTGTAASGPGPRSRPAAMVVVLVALFVSGLCAMAYEVLFVRVIGLVMGSSAYAFSVMLMGFIGGIALGSAIIGRLRVGSSVALLGITQLGIVVAFVVATPVLSRLPYLVDLLRVRLQGMWGGFGLHVTLSALLCLAVLLVPTVLLGFAFPLVSDLHARDRARTGAGVGTAYAVSTAGNVAGVFLGGLLLLPRLGLERAFDALWALQLAAGLLLLAASAARLQPASATASPPTAVALPPPASRLPRAPARATAAAVAVVVVTVALYLVQGRGWSRTLTLAPDHILLRNPPAANATAEQRARHPTSSFAAWKRRYLLSQNGDRFARIVLAEDAHNTVVAFGPDRVRGGSTYLAVNNKTDASTHDDLDTQLLLGHAPMFLAPRARTALVIGHGVGITAGAVLRHQPERVDLVEISPAVLQLDALFANENDYVLTDPRVHVTVDDGQSFLRATPHLYDVIISEPSNPWIAGVGDLFTVDFFQLARSKLAPGGVFAFWFHTYAQTDDTTRLLLRSLGSVFPHAELWSDAQVGNIVAVASAAPPSIDFAVLEARFADAAVARDLQRIQVPSLAALLTLHRRSQSFPWPALGPGPLNTLSRERLRHAAPRALFFGWSSFFIEQHDPLLQERPPPGTAPEASLFERYARYRASRNDPLRGIEYETVADWVEPRSGYGPPLAARLRARAETAPPTR